MVRFKVQAPEKRLTKLSLRQAFIALVLALALAPSPGLAETANSLLTAIRQTKAAGTDSVQVYDVHQEIIVSISSDVLPENALHDRANAVARVVCKECSAEKALLVLFILSGNQVKEASYTAGQMRALRSDDLSALANVSIFPGDQAGNLFAVSGSGMAAIRAGLSGSGMVGSSGAGTLASTGTIGTAASTGAVGTVASTGTVGTAASSEYQLQRQKMVARIGGLRAKGVGVQPFSQQLIKIDDQYKRANLDDAMAMLSDLNDSVADQERAYNELHPTAQLSAQYNAGTSRTVAGVSKLQGAPAQRSPKQEADQLVAMPQVGEYNNMDAFAGSVVSAALGGVLPHNGPFLMERIQIAKRIHELQLQKVNVQGYMSLFNKLDELAVVCRNDPRRNPELGGQIKYLQTQLGLSQVSGDMKHWEDMIFK